MKHNACTKSLTMFLDPEL